MRGLLKLTAATLASLVSNSIALPIVVYPGGKYTVDNIVYTTPLNTTQLNTTQIDTIQTDSNQTDTNQPDTLQTGTNQTSTNQLDTPPTDTNQTNSNQTDNNQTSTNQLDTPPADTNQTTSNQTDISQISSNQLNSTQLNATQPPAGPGGSSHALPISILNNFASNESLIAYVTGKDSTGAVVFLAPDGTFYYPGSAAVSTPVRVTADVSLALGGLGSTTKFTVPDYITSARVWVAAGALDFYTVTTNGVTALVEPSPADPSDPSSTVNWGIVELTNNGNGIYANLSFVDFVGLLMGMTLTLAGGAIQKVQGLAQSAIAKICSDLAAQTAIDGQPWADMCVTDTTGKALRILSPNLYTGVNPGDMVNYYADYVNNVWEKYTSEPLLIDTQSDTGKISCRVVDSLLTCDGDNRGYTKPIAKDIWSCNTGPFAIESGDNSIHTAIVPRLCAAFERSTLLLPGGNVQPSLGNSSYYTTSPCNHYSRLVHKYESDGLGYAFPYDDVNPSGENAAGFVAGPNPQLLQITLGGFA